MLGSASIRSSSSIDSACISRHNVSACAMRYFSAGEAEGHSRSTFSSDSSSGTICSFSTIKPLPLWLILALHSKGGCQVLLAFDQNWRESVDLSWSQRDD